MVAVAKMTTTLIMEERIPREDSRDKTREDRRRTTRPELYIRPCYSTTGRV